MGSATAILNNDNIINDNNSETSSSSSDVDECNVFVKYLPCEYTEKELFTLFQPYGVIINTKVMVNTKTGSSLGYGFVRFSEPDNAKEAINKMNRLQIGYKTLLCKLSKPSQSPVINPSNLVEDAEPREPSPSLYIRVLSPTVTDAMLKSAFEPFGEVVESQVLIDIQSGKSKRSGYVKFTNIQDATNAMNFMSGSLQLGDTPLIVRYSASKSKLNNSNNNINNNSNNNGGYLNIQSIPSPSSSPTQSHTPLALVYQDNSPTYTYVYEQPIHARHHIHHPQYYPVSASEYAPTLTYATHPYYTQPHPHNIIYYDPYGSPSTSPPSSPTHYPSYPTTLPPTYYLYTPTTQSPPLPPTYASSSRSSSPPPPTSPSSSTNSFLPLPLPQQQQQQSTSYHHHLMNDPSKVSLVCTYRYDIDFSELYQVFSKFGGLKSLKINNNNVNKLKSYITFGNVESAIQAQMVLDRSRVGHQQIRVKFQSDTLSQSHSTSF